MAMETSRCMDETSCEQWETFVPYELLPLLLWSELDLATESVTVRNGSLPLYTGKSLASVDDAIRLHDFFTPASSKANAVARL